MIVALNQIYEFGGFYNGTRLRVATDLNVRVRPGVIIYTSAEWNRVELDEGRFETRLFRVVPELQFSPWVSWVNNIQYDTQSAVLGWQSRFRWIVKPGQRPLFRLHTELGGRSAAEPAPHAGSDERPARCSTRTGSSGAPPRAYGRKSPGNERDAARSC